jgi:hypothetical protein
MDPLLKENLITTKDASELSGYTSDYLARLVRSGEITGKKIGHSWLVNTASLEIFLDTQKSFKSERARELASSRVKEYRLRHELAERALRDLTKKIPVASRTGHPVSEIGLTHVSLRSHLLALSSAFAVVIIGANLASAEVLPNLAGRVASIAEEVSSGFNETFGDLPSHITSKINAIHEAMQEDVSRVATKNIVASAELTSPLLSDPDLSYLQMALGNDQRTRVAMQLGSSTSKFASSALASHFVTRDDIQSSIVDAFHFLTSPAQVVATFTDAYVAIGYDAYALINSSLTSYRSLIEQSGERMLALAATTRDSLATTPRRISKMNLALGNAVIDATHMAIHAEVTLAYSPGVVAPEIARTTVALMNTVGDVLMRGTIATPNIVKMAFLRATRAPAELAPALAEAIFGAEYAGASRFVVLTTRVTDRYALALHSLGEAGYTGAVGTRSLANATGLFIAHAPIAIEDAYLGALGKTAVALDTITHTSPVAAVFVAASPAFSEGEKIALATYQTIYGLFDSVTSALAVLFTPPSLTPLPPSPVPEKKFATLTPPVRTTSYPTYTTVVQGVSPELMNQSLAALRHDVLSAITANTTRTIVTRFSDVRSDGVFNGGIFDRGSLTNGISVSAVTGHFDSLSAGPTNLATTTITGDLAVSGTITPAIISAGTYISAPYFVATSTTATSTFAGSINIDNAGFVYATSTRNVGIGVLSPAALLAIQNSTSTQPIFVASNAAGTEVYRITNNGFVGIGTTTPGYTLAVEGSSSLGNQAIAGYFTATTSTATSTFAGSLAVGTSSPWGNGLFMVGTSSPLLYVEANTGRIGLGTTSPESRLAIFDTGTQLRLNYDSSHYSDFKVASDGALAISPTNFATTTIANALALTMPQSYFLNNGKVGFGTLTPSAALEIATTSPQLRLAYNATNFTNFIIASDGALALTTTNTGTTTVTNAFSAASSLYVLNNGNVGINTLTPAYRLDVNGTVRSVGDAFMNSNVSLGDATSTDITYVNSRIADSLIPTVDNVLDFGDPTNWLRWRTGYFGTSIGIAGTATSTGVSLLASGAYLIDSASPLSLNTTHNQNVLFGTGNIGMGIAVPSYKLDVSGNAHFTSYVDAANFVATSTSATSTFMGGFTAGNNAAFTVNQASPANSLYVTSSGNVGINTLTPAYRLDVNGTIRSVGDAFFNTNTTLGSSTTTDITYFNSRIAGHLVPTVDNVSDLGDGANWLRWRTGYFGTSVGIAGTATSTGISLLASGAYLIDSTSPLSLNTTHNQNVLFGTGNVTFPNASTTNFSVASNLWVGGNATTTANGNITTNGNLVVRGTTNDIAGTLNLSGGALTSTGALGITSGGSGDLTLTSGSGNINLGSGNDILATGANSNIGSIGVKFNTIYADTISATTLVGVVSGGATNAADWVINNDNVSNDTEPMTLAFERGNVTPNALLSWNSAENAKRFELNQPLFIQMLLPPPPLRPSR